MTSTVSLSVRFALRELRNRYLRSLSGAAWAIAQPLLLLAVYSFVFVVIFKARVPEAEVVGFVPYLAVAFWPWTAFSESVMRTTTVVTENTALISKVPVPHEILVVSSVAATFALHMIGYAAVLIVLAATGVPLQWLYLPIAAVVVLLLFMAALGLGFLLAALQVFLPDLEHAVPPLMMLWFFSTPILYSMSLIPERLEPLAHANPMTYFVTTLRELLLKGNWSPGLPDLVALVMVLTIAWGTYKIFKRCSTRFEDFL